MAALLAVAGCATGERGAEAGASTVSGPPARFVEEVLGCDASDYVLVSVVDDPSARAAASSLGRATRLSEVQCVPATTGGSRYAIVACVGGKWWFATGTAVTDGADFTRSSSECDG